MNKKEVAKLASLYLTNDCCYNDIKVKYLYITKVEPERWSIGYKKTKGDNFDNAQICHRFIDEIELKKYEL